MSKGQLRYNQHFCISLKKNQGLAWHFGLGKSCVVPSEELTIVSGQGCTRVRVRARVCGVWAECLKQAVHFPVPSQNPSYRPGLSHTCPCNAQTAKPPSLQHRQDLPLPAANVTLETGAGSLWNHPRVLASPLT